MTRTAIRPTGVERSFGLDELIVSKTDLRGRITYANDVFLRVSCYEEHEVIGQPHNLIRHPDSPRGLFRRMWETIQAGDEMFVYLSNLASDGAHYWVLAHVTPSFDTRGEIVGFHSNRRVPEAQAVKEAEALYQQMLAAERMHADPVRAIEAGIDRLDGILAEKGMTYDEWVWDLTARSMEMK